MSIAHGPSMTIVAVLGVVAFAVAGAALVDVLESEPDAEALVADVIDDRETHVVEIEPAAGAPAGDGVSVLVGETEYVLGPDSEADASNASRTTTWWIDVEAGFPIKERIVTEHENPHEHVIERERTVRTVTYENVRFDEPIPDERFTFDPPDGTDIYEPAESDDVSTFAEAADAVPFPIAEPTPPEAFDLELVTANEFEGDATVQFLYRDGDELADDSLQGRITERPPTYDPEDVLEESVGDVDGSFVSTPMGTTLVWHCGDVRYELTPDVDGDEQALATTVAGSTGCPS
ncbi:hypothetical protein EA462_04195 [Natrarchaeobius halalkaliphilus]|uniref:DUF4367 domain-containing protein n=1 Tax=Natrarchaeobius halalkaliphilus TaxID=1679091 RepID=A0A3N6LP48_9EURY|nr:hypothetical protein [Natrarchaeobius halalkaliphilus]RQG91198.1 hypothetical protein EA462_04195 [Natrarchaeobius halalkaliphilus]